jgi:uncharacterized protein YacL
MLNLCAPALIYVAFSLTQVIIDTFKGLYNTAFLKVFVMIIITILLNSLCQAGMGIISWIIVFIPFIFMTIIVTILLYVFGLDPSTGKLNIKCDNCNDSKSTKKSGNPPSKKVKYIDVSYSDNPLDITDDKVAPFWSTDPEYE